MRPEEPTSESQAGAAKIWMAEIKKDAHAPFDAFVRDPQRQTTTRARVPDQGSDALLAFYDFLAEHWKHLRTTNVIESSFGTVRQPHHALQRISLKLDRARHDLQARREYRKVGVASMATSGCRKSSTV